MIKDDIKKVIRVLEEKKDETLKKYPTGLNQYGEEKINRIDIAIEEVRKLLGATLMNLFIVYCEYIDEDEDENEDENERYSDTKIVKATSKQKALQKFNDFAKENNYLYVRLNDIEEIDYDCPVDIE